MRLFFAIELPEALVRQVETVLESCRKVGDRALKLVEPSNIHITVKFLGEVEKEVAQEIIAAISTLSVMPFSLTLAGMGGFPNLVFPKVLWIGIGASEELKALFLKIEDISEKFGIPKEERRFSPHLTLARVKGEPKKETVKIFSEGKGREFGGFRAEKLTLFQSELYREGPVYTEVAEFPFQK